MVLLSCADIFSAVAHLLKAGDIPLGICWLRLVAEGPVADVEFCSALRCFVFPRNLLWCCVPLANSNFSLIPGSPTTRRTSNAHSDNCRWGHATRSHVSLAYTRRPHRVNRTWWAFVPTTNSPNIGMLSALALCCTHLTFSNIAT